MTWTTRGEKKKKRKLAAVTGDGRLAAAHGGDSRRRRLTVLVLEDVEDGEDLPVVGHQGFSHQLGRHHQVLQDLQRGADHLAVPGVQGVCGGEERRRGQSGRRPALNLVWVTETLVIKILFNTIDKCNIKSTGL